MPTSANAVPSSPLSPCLNSDFYFGKPTELMRVENYVKKEFSIWDFLPYTKISAHQKKRRFGAAGAKIQFKFMGKASKHSIMIIFRKGPSSSISRETSEHSSVEMPTIT